VNQGHERWKQKLATEFQRAVRAAFKSLDGEAALNLCKCSPLQLLDAVSRSDDGALEVRLADVVQVREAVKPPRNVGESIRSWYHTKPGGNWRFLPKQPRVKLVPDVGYSIGHMLISREVGVELLVRALRSVVDERNLLRLGIVERHTAVTVLSATIRASFAQQREHFSKRGCGRHQGRTGVC
jgi:hypothetical protein